ncbi:MAG: hypothetical protein ABR577_08230 [Pyrinomonadaceae bacterium]
MRRLPLNQPNYIIHRERDGRALVRLGALLLCGLVLAGGFVFAAGQHFAAVSYGYKSEELRRERARLLERQAALLLAREEASTPARLETAAREIGMQPIAAAQIGGAQANDAQRTERSLPHASPAFVGVSARLNR